MFRYIVHMMIKKDGISYDDTKEIQVEKRIISKSELVPIACALRDEFDAEELLIDTIYCLDAKDFD